jgi:hypothetical protein
MPEPICRHEQVKEIRPIRTSGRRVGEQVLAVPFGDFDDVSVLLGDVHYPRAFWCVRCGTLLDEDNVVLFETDAMTSLEAAQQETSPAENDMQELATQTALDLGTRIGVDGVIVVIVRKGDDTMGCALNAPHLPVDVMIGCMVQLIGEVRGKLVQAFSADNSNDSGDSG